MELASRINRAIDERALEELGTLEQDLVYGDATSREVITFLSNRDNAGALPADKVAPASGQKGSLGFLGPSVQSSHGYTGDVSPAPIAQRQHLTVHCACPIMLDAEVARLLE